ncbi:transportin-1-like isoform X3 [Tripterygium wilfordii]|nr:transportin-1-like isoform X2 [Tripterygium wilfordii]XP_038684423.1 transportin-1-like isoform X3 [Tripterygium wilfordii]
MCLELAMEVIFWHLLCAFGRWNSIPLLGDSANTAGADQISLRNFMSPLIAKWQQISNSDKNLFPSFLCSVVQLYIHRTG